MNHYNDYEHIEVAQAIANIQNIHWVVSYDNTPQIEAIYSWVSKTNIAKYSFNHSAYKARAGQEILFFSKGLKFNLQELVKSGNISLSI